MNIEIINIGDEILIGQIVNTNSAWMAQELNLMGASVKQVTVVADEREHILSSLKLAGDRADVILITGGLGPTKDDITKKTLCEFFSCGLVFSEEAYKDVERLFLSRGLQVTALNKMQAEVPEKCKVIANPKGTAPGMWFEENGKIYVSMPGVPYEMKAMMQNYVMPALKQKFNLSYILHKTVLTQGIGESFLSEIIAEWENSLSKLNIKLAYLPSPGVVRLRLSAKGDNQQALEKNTNEKIEELKKIIPDYYTTVEIFGEERKELQHIVGELLAKQNKTLATAESCTGGYIAHLITSVPGSSSYFLGSIVSYSNQIKEDTLLVNSNDIHKYGAVSKQVVEQMALGVKKLSRADYALATSGIAGPSGGTKEKPVGLVWIALAYGDKVVSDKFLFGTDRQRNIHKAAVTALSMLRKELVLSL